MKIWLRLLLVLLSTCGFVAANGVKDESIKKITSAVWDSDVNKFGPKDLIFNPKGKILFEHVNEEKLIGTYKLLMDLFDNYVKEIGVKEVTNKTKVKEENAFLDAVLVSGPMKLAHEWLIQQKLASADKKVFKKKLREYWFLFYSRSSGKVLDSSGFEHVFLGELKKDSVTGFHNWLFTYLQEREGTFKYNRSTNECENNILTLNFTWHGKPKSKSTVIFGVSPETELAIFTICFLTRPGKACPIQISEKDYKVLTYKMADTMSVSTSYVLC